MPQKLSYGPVKNKRELSALLDILAPTFNFTRSQGDDYSRIVGVKNYRIIKDGATVLGGCALLPLGQFFGGRRVPMTGIGAVAIAPEHRGRRTATFLMQSAVKEMHRRGDAISTLYPATLPLYRSVGYEQAGGRFEMWIPAKTLHSNHHDPNLTLRKISPRDEKAVREAYRRRAQDCPGNLDRSEFIWHRVKNPRGKTTRGYAAINHKSKSIEAYCYYYQKENTILNDAAHAPLAIQLTDVAALTPEAGRTLLGFLARHRSMCDTITFQGRPDDPLLKLMPERNYGARLIDHWMTRIVDVRQALEWRGYPPMACELHFHIADDLVSANQGDWVLRIEDGKPNVRRGGDGDLHLDIRGLAALYTGFASPHDLIVTGQLTCDLPAKRREIALAQLGAAFAGQSPWMADMF